MKWLLLLSLLASLRLLQAAELVRPNPDDWSILIFTSASTPRFQHIIEINCTASYGTEIVVRYGEIGKSLLSYKNLYVGKLNQSETDLVWNAFKGALEAFTLRDPRIKALDGKFVDAELRVGSNSLRFSYANLVDSSDASAELNKIIRMTEDRAPAYKSREKE
jgi:hypothetical protein